MARIPYFPFTLRLLQIAEALSDRDLIRMSEALMAAPIRTDALINRVLQEERHSWWMAPGTTGASGLRDGERHASRDDERTQIMRQWMIGIVAAGVGLAVAMPTMAQTRPQVSGSESSRRIEATCTVNGDEQACGGMHPGVLAPGSPGPIMVGISPVLIPAVIPAGIPGLGAGSGGHAGTATDVDRTTHHGREITR